MKYVVGILALLVVLGVSEGIRQSYVETVATVSTGGPASCIEMLGSTTAEESGNTSIVGNVRNNCGRSVGSVTVVFGLEPSSGARDARRTGGTFYAYVRDLKAGETRRFKTMFPIGKNRTYYFEGINAF